MLNQSHGFIGIVFLMILLLAALGTKITYADEAVTGEMAVETKNAIDEYVKQDSNLKGSFFIYDEITKQVLDLKYDHTHKTVKKTDSGKYLACVDFVDDSKTIYDLDFYLDKTHAGNWEVYEIAIHKVNGQSRLQ